MASPTVEHLLDVGFADTDRLGLTLAVVALGSDGSVLAERYGLPSGRDEAFISWSMAKSVTHMAAGVARVDLGARDLFPTWADDGRADIAVEHLLRMQDGLVWFEDYVDAGTSDVLEMLFGSGADDVVGYAAGKPLEVPPGSRWRYSSGTSNLLADVVRRHAGIPPGDDWHSWLVAEVCGPAGMSAGTRKLI